jgi:hypothetical protein
MGKKRRDLPKDRHTEAYNNKGGSTKGFLDFSGLDKAVDFFKPDEGKWHKIIIVPYEIKSKNHPGLRQGREIGDLDYVLDIWTHRNVGPADVDIICPKKNYGKPCPVCELADELKEKGDEKGFGESKASRRAVYNVIDVKKPDAGLKVFSVSHFLFEKPLDESAMSYDVEGEMVTFASIENGRIIRFKAVDSGNWIDFKSFQFEERGKDFDADYIDELVDDAISFGECIEVKSYADIKAIMYGQDTDTPEDEEEEDEEKEESDEKESRKSRREKRKKAKEKRSKKVKKKCPHGHEFGKDPDEYEDCEECEIYDDCESEWEENEGDE